MVKSGKGGAYHHGDLRAALLREGRKLLEEEGYERLSLRRLASRVGVSPMAFYRHFATKDDFYAAVVADAFERFARALESSVDPASNPREQLIGIGVGYIRFFTANPDILKVLFISVGERNSSILKRLARGDEGELRESLRKEPSFRLLLELSTKVAAQEPGRDAGELALIVWSRAQGLASMFSQEPWFYDSSSFTDAALAALLGASI